ncbi:MAG: hypothetical protein ABI321_03330 [Polyangia bacterium]
MTRVLHRSLCVALLALSACASPDGTTGTVGVSQHPDLGAFINGGDMTIALAKADLASESGDDLSSSVSTDLATPHADFSTKPVDFSMKPADMTTASGCGSVTYAGTCSGNTVTYCSNNTVKTLVCSSPRQCNVVAGDADCRYVNGSACGNVSFDGLCDGDTLVYCDSSQLTVTDCTALGSTCTTGSSGLAYCN